MANFLKSFLLAVFGCFMANPKAEFFFVTQDAMCFHDEHHAKLRVAEIGGEYQKITWEEVEAEIKKLKELEAKATQEALKKQQAEADKAKLAKATESKKGKAVDNQAPVIEEVSKTEQA